MDVKRELSVELASVIKVALKEDASDHDVLSSDIVNNICNVTEAIFIHGLKSIYFLNAKTAKYPEPNFWPFITKFSHRNVRSQLSSLSQIKNDIGKARAWIRLTLNEAVLENYLTSFGRERSIVRKYYHRSAYLLDAEQIEVFINYMKAMSRLRIKAPVNSTLLNEWTPTPLRLAGLLNPRLMSPGVVDMDDVDNVNGDVDVMVGVSALDYFNPAGDDDSSDAASVTSSVAPSLPSRLHQKNRIFSDDESSIYSHPSMCDAKFAAVMQDMLVCKSGSSGTPGPTYDDPDLVDSGMASSELSSQSSQNANRVVVHRKTSSSAKLANNRSRSSPTMKKLISEASIQTETIPEGESVTKEDSSYSQEETTAETPSKLEDESFTTALESSVSMDVPNDTDGGYNSGEQVFAEVLSSSLPPSDSAFNSGEYERNTSDLKTEMAESQKSENQNLLPPPDKPKKKVSLQEGPPAGTYSPGNSLLGRSQWSTSNVDLEDGIEEESNRSTASSIAGNGEPSFFDQSGLEPQDSFGNLLTRTLERYDPEPSKIVEKEGQESSENFVTQMNEGETEIGVALGDGPRTSPDRGESPSKGFVIVESDENQSNLKDSQERMKMLSRLPGETGLDSQSYTCRTCKRPIGLLYGPFRVCSYDGCYYCKECHRNDEAPVPSKMILSWDLKPKRVSRASKAFLEHVSDQPLLNLEQINNSLYDAVPEIKETFDLRQQLSYVAAYLMTCKESVAEDLRKRLWPKEYLHTEIHLYSANDLINVSSGVLQKHLRSVITFAIAHVMGCPLCSQKGFVCECGKLPCIFPFQVEVTTRCAKCFAVFHNACVEGRPCPKCVRREKYYRKRKESASQLGESSLDSQMSSIVLDDD